MTPQPKFMSVGTVVAILAASVPGFFQGLTTPEIPARVAVGILVVLTLLVSTIGMGLAERKGGPRAIRLTMALYAALVIASLALSGDRTFLVAMPFVSMMVLFLPLWVALGGTAVLTVVMALIASRELDAPTVATLIAQFTSAEAFVLVFSFIARRERFARHEVERLSLEVAELATARERNRVARELHDSLGHCLTIATVQLEAARAQPDQRDERIAQAQKVLREGLAELRNTVTLLREPRPLTEALQGLVAETTTTGLHAALELSGSQRVLASELDLVLFRAAQEALTNARRHSGATRVDVKLAFEPSLVRLAVHDDGAGQGEVREGNGLTGVRERVAQFGGSVLIDRAATGGVQLIIEVPTK